MAAARLQRLLAVAAAPLPWLQHSSTCAAVLGVKYWVLTMPLFDWCRFTGEIASPMDEFDMDDMEDEEGFEDMPPMRGGR